MNTRGHPPRTLLLLPPRQLGGPATAAAAAGRPIACASDGIAALPVWWLFGQGPTNCGVQAALNGCCGAGQAGDCSPPDRCGPGARTHAPGGLRGPPGLAWPRWSCCDAPPGAAAQQKLSSTTAPAKTPLLSPANPCTRRRIPCTVPYAPPHPLVCAPPASTPPSAPQRAPTRPLWRAPGAATAPGSVSTPPGGAGLLQGWPSPQWDPALHLARRDRGPPPVRSLLAAPRQPFERTAAP